MFEWTIAGDTASISGYNVQKATTHFGGRDWIAWFTPEIPYRDGPYKFKDSGFTGRADVVPHNQSAMGNPRNRYNNPIELIADTD